MNDRGNGGLRPAPDGTRKADPMKQSDRGRGRTLVVNPRYARICTDPGVEMAERNYQYRELAWRLPVQETALICIDCWAWHFSRETLARIEDIMRNRIAPLLAACRRAAMPVIHLPANPLAERHPNFLRMRPPDALPQPPWPDSPAWPPAEFRAKTGPYAQYAKPAEPQNEERIRHRESKRDFHDLCRPEAGEPVLLDGEDLHRYCARQGILHLFFIWFNTNACVMMRDYGLPEMSRRGYHAILLRDCTTGMEIADTVEGLVCTAGTIATIEQFLGFTLTSEQLIGALSSWRTQRTRFVKTARDGTTGFREPGR